MLDAYLGVPYSHKDSKIRKWRFDRVTEATAHLMKKGEYTTVYSPITHSHLINSAKIGSESFTWDFWIDEYDLNFLAVCKVLLVLQLPGWEASKGVAAEIDYALEKGIPVKMASPVYDEMFRIREVRIEE